MEKIQQLLTRVDVLPLSPALLPKLLPALSDVDTNFDEVVQIIALDPALTAKLLQICNSAFFGMENPVSSVAEAVNQVGYQSVYLLVAMINGSNSFPTPSPPGVDAARLWRHSVSTAFNAKFVAESAGVDANLLFTAGLLHDIGKVILGQLEPIQMAGTQRVPYSAAIAEKEQTLFHCSHAEVGATLLAGWKLPAPIVAAVRGHHDWEQAKGFEEIAACVTLGDLLAYSDDIPKVTDSEEFKKGMKFLEMSPDVLGRWREKLRRQQDLINGMSKLV